MATSLEAFKSFKSTGILVFANSKTDSKTLPKGVKSIRAEGGNTIPMVFVTSSDGANGLKAIDYKTLKGDMRDAVRELKKTISELPEEEVNPSAEPAEKKEEATEKEEASELLAERQEWSNKEGVIITAAIQSADDEKVTFLMDNKKLVPYPLSKLSKESQEKVSELSEE